MSLKLQTTDGEQVPSFLFFKLAQSNRLTSNNDHEHEKKKLVHFLHAEDRKKYE